VGTRVAAGDRIALAHGPDETSAKRAVQALELCIHITDKAAPPRPTVLERITAEP